MLSHGCIVSPGCVYSRGGWWQVSGWRRGWAQLQWRKLLGLSADQVTEDWDCFCCAAALDIPCFSSLFLTVYTSQLCWSGWGETEVGPLCSALKGWGRWSLILPSKENFFELGSFPFRAEECQLRGWEDAGKMKCLLSLNVWLFSGSTVLMKFPKWTPELPRAVLIHRELPNYWSLLGNRGWGLLCCHFGDITHADHFPQFFQYSFPANLK